MIDETERQNAMCPLVQMTIDLRVSYVPLRKRERENTICPSVQMTIDACFLYTFVREREKERERTQYVPQCR